MKRFKIENKVNGNKFEVQAEEWEQAQWHPEFGRQERWVDENFCSEADKLAALESRDVVDPISGDSTKEYRLPAEFEFIEEDMTAEIAAREAQEDAIKQAGVFLKGLKKSDLTDLDKCASAIMKIVKYLRADV